MKFQPLKQEFTITNDSGDAIGIITVASGGEEGKKLTINLAESLEIKGEAGLGEFVESLFAIINN